MYSFKNDYAEGAHPAILNKLVETNLLQEAGYGEDTYTEAAKEKIRAEIKNPNADIYFLSAGTQTNLIVISSVLRVHEAVISAETGHIYANETGAIEATGHKVIPVQTANGKLTVAGIEQVVKSHQLRPHVVQPKLVYISNSTELGTIYLREDLEQIAAYCKQNGLYLFMDGARLGHALTAANNDVTLEDIAKLTDVFYIGGTKNGALLGEAVVFGNSALSTHFDYSLKQKGALLAKGRVLGIQFLTLFTDNLYYSLALHANTMAIKLAVAIENKGYTFMGESTTNQLFPILPLTVIATLSQHFDFYVWKPIDEHHAAIRLITSWATKESEVDKFIEVLNASV